MNLHAIQPVIPPNIIMLARNWHAYYGNSETRRRIRYRNEMVEYEEHQNTGVWTTLSPTALREWSRPDFAIVTAGVIVFPFRNNMIEII